MSTGWAQNLTAALRFRRLPPNVWAVVIGSAVRIGVRRIAPGSSAWFTASRSAALPVTSGAAADVPENKVQDLFGMLGAYTAVPGAAMSTPEPKFEAELHPGMPPAL